MTGRTPSRADVDRLVRDKGVVAAGNACQVAGILYTYRCTIACRHCCFGSSTARPDVRMTTGQVVRHLRSLHALGRVVHIAGGECMMYWADLRAALAAARAEGLAPHFVETNASFAVSDEVASQRVKDLLGLGVIGLLVSADPYHQAFVPPEHVIRLRRIAREAMGPENIWTTDEPDERIREFAEIARDALRLRKHVRAYPPMMVGTAQRTLAPHLDARPVGQLGFDVGWRRRHTGWDCALEFDAETMWEVHVDPYDNIQTNCGVILGSAARTSPVELLRRGPGSANELVALLCREGPVGLARLARARHGYAIPERARTKCDLCYQVRKFLRPHYPEILGPDEVYAS